MAASMICCIHLVENLNDHKITGFSEKSLDKILHSQSEWINLDGEEKIVAENLSKFDLKISSNVGYHRQCYMRFTDRTRIEKAKKRTQVKRSNENSESSRLNRRLVFQKSANTGVFPDICVICRKEQYVTEKHSLKRKREKLLQCLTENTGASLQKSAELMNDEALKIQIDGIDCIAKEVKYHRSCYLNYTSVLKRNCNEVFNCESRHLFKSYKMFCNNVIERRIINCGEILNMNKLLKLFKNIMEKNEENADVDNRQLKRWLLRDYPHIIFVKPRKRNMSELVLCQSSDKEAIIFQEAAESTTDSQSEGDELISSKN